MPTLIAVTQAAIRDSATVTAALSINCRHWHSSAKWYPTGRPSICDSGLALFSSCQQGNATVGEAGAQSRVASRLIQDKLVSADICFL